MSRTMGIALAVVAGVAGAAARAGEARLQDAFATVQRDGRPYNTFYSYYVAPHAIEEKGTVFCAHQDGQGRPVVTAYDVEARTWSAPVRASGFGLGRDTHGNPSICIDAKGHIHLFFGCHGRAMRHVRSTRPYDITAWEVASSPAKRATYPESMRMADGRLLLFFRAGGHPAPWTMVVSKDDGATWSKGERIVELRRDTKRPGVCAYCTFLPGAEGKTVHGVFLYKDDAPRANKRKVLGLHEAVYRYHVYYIFRDAAGRWHGLDGELPSLPLGLDDADRHAKVYDSGENFASHRHITVDRRNRPYLRFAVGIRDWKHNKTFVPLKTKYAGPRDGRWQVTESVPDAWPAEVRQRIDLPGPEAYGPHGEGPSPWYIHHRKGPKADPTRTYVWLGHVEQGYAPRPDGPVPSPK